MIPEDRSVWTRMEEKGIEYKSPEYWAYLQDRAGKSPRPKPSGN